ncbi:uncharacterized protein LOC100198634 isoform X1 [Hydra vulgaris]|uniref:uncharacterized protein LOC100198634 isoform X1 n=1 Tax=Hydra vulgaris TaxID=6087 RepID=UPI001F5EF982|nr:uncharacterized protein LOC100198634 [Hydra vulgaris]
MAKNVDYYDDFLMQKGLLFAQPKYGCVFIFKETDRLVDKKDACLKLKAIIYKIWLKFKAEVLNVVAAFDPQVWEDSHKDLPEWISKAGTLEKRSDSNTLVEGKSKFKNTGGFAIVMVRKMADHEKDFLIKIESLKIKFTKFVETYHLELLIQECDGKDAFSGLYIDGLGNKSEPSILQDTISCIPGVNGYPGGSYMLQQQLDFTWNILSQQNATDIALMIGRHKDNTMLIGNNERTHITCVHKVHQDINARSKYRLHRISMPYTYKNEKSENQPGGFGGANKESGLFYISFSKSTEYILDILKDILGEKEDCTNDLLIAAMQSKGGAFYYTPAVKEFGDGPIVGNQKNTLLIDHWNVRHPSNYRLFYNHKEYLYRMGLARITLEKSKSPKRKKCDIQTYPEPLSERILHLTTKMFEDWEDTWFKQRNADPLPHLEDQFRINRDIPISNFNGEKIQNIMSASLQMRCAVSLYLALSEVYTTSDLTDNAKDSYGVKNETFQLNPKDLIAGKIPVYGLGVGQLAMPYLTKDIDGELSSEHILAYAHKLSETSGFGHVIPNYQKIIQKGLPTFLKEIKSYMDLSTDSMKKEFYWCCLTAFKGIQKYLENYANLALFLANRGVEKDIHFAISSTECNELYSMAQRLNWLANGNGNGSGKPRNFLEATQLLFTLHCCLHLCCEPVSIGRFDVILEEFFDPNDRSNQDVVDAFWIKIGEKVQLNRETRLDLYTVGTIAVPYRSDGMFARGDGCNQWVQQLTIGGFVADDSGERVLPSAKRIEISKLCLRSARRLPLNAPCLSLRVYSGMDDILLKEAAYTILSGGAHPVLPHDDLLIPALINTGLNSKDAINYSSDGCYEPIVPGKTEFSFAYVALLPILEMTLNRGATISNAGPAGMRGYAVSRDLRPDSGDIKSLDDIKKHFGMHLRLQMNDALSGLLSNYGNINTILTTPLLSSMIDGCLEKGRDHYNGGAELKMIGLMVVSFANTVDSLYAIQELCFGDKSFITLDQLVRTLQSDWGFDLQEPWFDPVDGEIGKQISAANMKLIREVALSLPKLGLATKENERNKNTLSSYCPITLKEIASWLAKEIVLAFTEVTTLPKYTLNNIVKSLTEKYGTSDEKNGKKPFINFQLGSGTFEGYVGWGLGIGASADGRRKGQPLASDMSPAPLPQDISDSPRKVEDIYKILEYYDIEELKTGFSNGTEIDLTIDEDTNEEDLFQFLRNYADRKKSMGGNVLTLTCASQDTYRAAMKNPEKYDLVRVRTGGWGEFFISFYSAHQKQHLRRTFAIVSSS